MPQAQAQASHLCCPGKCFTGRLAADPGWAREGTREPLTCAPSGQRNQDPVASWPAATRHLCSSKGSGPRDLAWGFLRWSREFSPPSGSLAAAQPKADRTQQPPHRAGRPPPQPQSFPAGSPPGGEHSTARRGASATRSTNFNELLKPKACRGLSSLAALSLAEGPPGGPCQLLGRSQSQAWEGAGPDVLSRTFKDAGRSPRGRGPGPWQTGVCVCSLRLWGPLGPGSRFPQKMRSPRGCKPNRGPGTG